MKNIYNLASAGMIISAIIESIQTGKWNGAVPNYETRKYLIEKLEEAFFSVQSDITEAVVTAAANLTESEEEK